MGIALLTLSGLFRHLPDFHPSKSAKFRRAIEPSPYPGRAVRPTVCTTTVSKPMSINTQRLEVLRLHEFKDRPQTTGRMVISGRMSDVCAELDRLAALEMMRSRN